jgi:hypothetical protein
MMEAGSDGEDRITPLSTKVTELRGLSGHRERVAADLERQGQLHLSGPAFRRRHHCERDLALAQYDPGAEARARYGLLLARLGSQHEARTLLTETLTQLKRAPKFVRKVQAEWIAMAETAVRA